MSTIGQTERATQNRVIALFCDELCYRYLGDWTDHDGNSNIEEELLTAYLTKRKYTPAQINIAIHKLRTEADNHSRGLYGNNKAVYNLLRYGVPVKTDAGKATETVHIIDWDTLGNNDFAIAEECNEWNECGDYVEVYGNLVFVVEYNQSAFEEGCENFPDLSIILRNVSVSPNGPYDAC